MFQPALTTVKMSYWGEYFSSFGLFLNCWWQSGVPEELQVASIGYCCGARGIEVVLGGRVVGSLVVVVVVGP